MHDATPKRAEPRKGARNLNCHHYMGCVTRAVQGGWENFTCEACPLRSTGEAPRAEAFLVRRGSFTEVE